MKKNILLLLIFTMHFAFAQTGKVVYEFIYQGKIDDEYYTKRSAQSLEIATLIHQNSIDAQRFINTLLFDAQHSYFYTEMPLKSDGERDELGIMYFILGESIWGDSALKAIFYETKIPATGEKVLCRYDSDFYTWTVSNESKKIAGYTAYKAVYEHDKYTLTAWYAPSLPYSYGPTKYFGLPGLILEINRFGKGHTSANGTLRAKSVSFHTKETVPGKPHLTIFSERKIDSIYKEAMDRRKEFRTM